MAAPGSGVELANKKEEVPIHLQPIEDVLKKFSNVDPTKGLSSQEAARLFEIWGPNELEKPPRISLFMLFIIQLNSVIMYLLMAAVVASAVIRATGDDRDKFISYVDSIAIMIIVLINATIAAVTENNANDALDALSSLQSPKSKVFRDGKIVEIDAVLLVPGDIVELMTGDIVPADLRNIEANDLKVHEMLLTGEPEDVAKSTQVKPPEPGKAEKLTADNMVFSSCQVKNGTCRGVVVATGMNTRVGKIAALLTSSGGDDDEDDGKQLDLESGKEGGAPKKKKQGCLPDTKANWSPLQVNLEKLAVKLGYMAIAVCVIVFVVGASMGTKDPESPETPSWLFMILVAVTLTVAAIPEGLPLCVTISLSEGCKSMVDEKVLMRKIAAVETLGSASIICTDKTGTLTEGKMTLVAMFTGGTEYKVEGKGFVPEGEITKPVDGKAVDGKQDECVRATLGSAILCSNTKLVFEVDEKDKDDPNAKPKWIPKGNSSEAPLVVGARKIGLVLEDLQVDKDDKEKKQPLERVFEIPFSSSRKMMVTITKTLASCALKHLSGVGEHTAHVKGAPNYILQKCTQYMDADGNIKPLDKAMEDEIMSKVDELSERALRVLAIASCDLGPQLPFDQENDDTDVKFDKVVAGGLTLCGLCASIDPERDGVKQAVLDARTAGVRVVMITGDYLKTAIAIAKNINILNADTFTEGNGEATDCGSLRPDGPYISPEAMHKITASTSVFARAKPEDKLEIVKSLQKQGWVCAMTGDGVNDAPALQEADIGVAMGLEGTEVAKGASDMILVDDNFCSIVKAIYKGRVIYAGIQKFVSFIMSVHFAEVLQIFLCIVTSIPVMRQPLQILFLILVTDLPPSIALGFEPGEELTMKRKPRPKTQPVVLPWMWRGIVANGVILTICIFSTYILALHAYAGAFTSDDITDPLRPSCAIWKHDSWRPNLIESCGKWVLCGHADEKKDDALCADFIKANPVWSKTDYFLAHKKPEELDVLMADAGATSAYYNYDEKCSDCIEKSIRRARTSAFISLVWAEGFRAYCSRSFDNFVWVNTWSNMSMNKAVAMAQVTLMLALFIPGLSDQVLGLYVYEIQGFGWFIAFVGAFSCLVFCEFYKWLSKGWIEGAELANYSEDGAGAGEQSKERPSYSV